MAELTSALPPIQQDRGSARNQTFYSQFPLWLAVSSAGGSTNSLWGDVKSGPVYASLHWLSTELQLALSEHRLSWKLEVHPAEPPGWHTGPSE